MRELAARAGVGVGTIFQHFADKASLLVAAFEDDLDRIARQGYETMPPRDIRAQLLHICGPVLQFYESRPQLGRVLVQQGLFLTEPAAEQLGELDMVVAQRLHRLLSQARDRGELRPDVDLETVVGILWGFYLNTILFGLKAPVFDAETLLQLLAKQVGQLLEGIGARS